jgi:DeoR/GlpR family transcriptional regulator of sugar metabolism
MLPAVRHRLILDLLRRREYVTIGEAREVTGVSAATTHRDLARLAAAGVLTRIRGGATRPVRNAVQAARSLPSRAERLTCTDEPS